MAVRAAEGGVDEGELYSRRFLLRRPLLEALEADGPVVLLIDEIDRADDEFEAFLLELLSDFQVTIPELGTITRQRAPARRAHLQPHARAARRAQAPLHVPLDRLPRSRARGGDRAHARARAPRRPSSTRVVEAVARLRGAELYKLPGVGETIAWAQALGALGRERDARRHARRRAQGARGPRPRPPHGSPRWCLRSSPWRARCARAGRGSGRARSRRRRARWASWAPRATTPTSALRAVMCSRREDLAIFDAAFDEVFAGADAGRVTPPFEMPPGVELALPRVARPRGRAVAGSRAHRRAPRRVERRRAAASTRTSPQYTDEERAQVRAVVAQLARHGPTRRSRRLRSARLRGVRPDLQRDAARVAALGRRAARAPLARARPEAAQARARLRRLGLDGALRAGAAAVPARRGGDAPARRGLRLRHAADAAHARARRARSRPRAGARVGGRRGLVGRHAHRPFARRRSTASTAAAWAEGR